MAETIKTILTADATAYEAGFRRGGNALSAHLSKEKEFFARSISGHQDQIRSLKLQADGYTNLAQSLTQTLSIEKEARKLAASGLITEEKAIAMLREKQILQGQIAAQAAQEAAARQKAAQLEQSQKALALEAAAAEKRMVADQRARYEAQSNAILEAAAASRRAEKEAAREKEQSQKELSMEAAAAEKRMQADIRGRYEAQSNAILQAAAESRRAEQEAAKRHATAIANPRATGLPGGGGVLAPLTPQSLQMIERGIAGQRELGRQAIIAGRGGYTGSMGFLAFSQAVEDAQYGIKGVLNNIPQMVMGFGGGMGLAGAISLAAVAAVTLYPHLKRLYGVTDNENVKAAAAEWGKIFNSGMAAANEFERGVVAEREMRQLAQDIEKSLRERFALSGQMAAYYDSELQAARDTRDMQIEILAARQRLAEAQGDTGAANTIRGQITGEQNAGNERDLQNRLDEQSRINAELQRLDESRVNAAQEKAEAEVRANEQIAEAMRRLAGAQANLSGAEADVKNTPSGRGAGLAKVALKDSQARVAAIQQEIKALQDSQKVQSEKYDSELNGVQTTIDALNKKNDAVFKEGEAIKKLIEQLKALQAIEDEARKADVVSKWREQMEKEQEARDRLDKQAQPILEERQKLKEKQDAAKAEFAAEFMILQLRRNGQGDLATAIEQENALRKEALSLAEATGLTEQEALRRLREKKALEKEIEGIRGGLPVRSRLRQEEREAARAQRREDARQRNAAAGGIAQAGRGGRSLLNQNRGLQNAEMIRREAERRQAAAGKDPVPAFWEKQLDLQERLVAHFDKLIAI
jgi:hypothetical protein